MPEKPPADNPKKSDARENRPFTYSERRDIYFPMWRKKVDRSVFSQKMITVHSAFLKFWNIPAVFQGITSTRDPRSKIKILFEGREYSGNITNLGARKRKNSYRISYARELRDRLKEVYVMTFMRDLEFEIGGDQYVNEQQRTSIEEVIPFWEFLDIEYDAETRLMYFTCHFRQRPTFQHLFSRVVDSTILRAIESQLQGKDKQIISEPWRTRAELKQNLDVPNAIYYLLDEDNEEIYIGKSQEIKSRLRGERKEIVNWTHYRYDVLPQALAPFLEEIELMLISAFMHVCKSGTFRGAPKLISNYTLTNKKYRSKK